MFAVPDDAYSVLTPYGTLAAFFPDDGPVLWTGPDVAQEYFAQMLLNYVLPGGHGTTMGGISENTLANLSPGEEWGIEVQEPKEYSEPLPPGTPEPELLDFECRVSSGDPSWPTFDPQTLRDL